MGDTTIPGGWRRSLWVIGLIAGLATVSCDRSKSGNASGPNAGGRKIASLSPAATEILIGVGVKDQLVAVSNWESSASVTSLPRGGDYQTTDWETLARLRPVVMVT